MSTVTSPPPSNPDPILDPVADCLTPEVAQRLLLLRLSPTVQARVDELAAKSQDGSLTDSERQEYEAIVEKADLLGIVKSLARRVVTSSKP